MLVTIAYNVSCIFSVTLENETTFNFPLSISVQRAFQKWNDIFEPLLENLYTHFLRRKERGRHWTIQD